MRKNWLNNYLAYTSDQESPEMFHLWTGLSVLAGCLGRNLWIDRGYDLLYPNMFVILVAPSGRCRKGGAIKIGAKFLNWVGAKMIMEKITPQALSQYMAAMIEIIDKQPRGESKAFIFAPELAVFLGKEASQNGLLALLTTLWDCPKLYEYRTKTAGTDILANVCLNILGASTPEWLVQGIPADAIGGGFTSRIMFVAQTETPRHTLKPKFSKEIEAWLIERLAEIMKLKGELEMSKGGEEFFQLWYSEREPPSDDRFLSFFEREHEHILKVAILLAASHGDLFHSNVISRECLQEAIILVDRLKSYMGLAYAGIGEHPSARGYDKIIEQIKRAGGEAEHSWLLRKNYYQFDKDGFKKVIELLEDTNRIKRRITRTGKTIYALMREEK